MPDRLRIFVGGPIQYARLPGANEFDRRLRSTLELIHEALQREGHTVLSAHKAERFGDGTVPRPEEVTSRDFLFSQECDVYIACLPCSETVPYRTDGTYIELGWVTATNTPCIVLWDEAERSAYSYLVQGLPAVSDTTFVALNKFLEDPSVLLVALPRRAPGQIVPEPVSSGGAA